MVNDFIKGIAAGLKSKGYPIYTEEMPTGFTRPCFTVRAEPVSEEPAIGGYLRHIQTFVVEYYGKKEETGKAGKNYTSGSIEPFIYDALRWVRASGRLYHAAKISSERKSQRTTGNISSNVEGVGGVLTVTAIYRRFVKASEKSELMERLYEV